jgi:hypothetical protein
MYLYVVVLGLEADKDKCQSPDVSFFFPFQRTVLSIGKFSFPLSTGLL